MGLICRRGHYLGGQSVCPICGVDSATTPGSSGSASPFPTRNGDSGAVGDGFDNTPQSGAPGQPAGPAPASSSPFHIGSWGDDPVSGNSGTTPGPATPVPQVDAPWGELRGTVVEGESIRVTTAGGVRIVRLLLTTVLLITILVRREALLAAVTNGIVSLLLTFLFPILMIGFLIALVSRLVPFGGCLGGLMKVLTFSALNRRGTPTNTNGWRLTIDTPQGEVAAEVATSIPLNGGEQVSLHGPVIGRTKHAWLIQGITPRPFTKLGRGVLRLLLSTFVLVPLMVLLVAYI